MEKELGLSLKISRPLIFQLHKKSEKLEGKVIALP